MNPPVIILPDPLMLQCRAFGQQSVDGYRTGKKSTAQSRDGAEANVELQTMARIAECAVCLWARFDPLTTLDWSPKPDAGYDLCLRDWRFDIKSSSGNAQYLIWPRSKNDEFGAKQFDAMALVRVRSAYCELVGWADKEIFRIHHEVAPDNHKLQPGTWFMDASRLYPFYRDAWGIADG